MVVIFYEKRLSYYKKKKKISVSHCETFYGEGVYPTILSYTKDFYTKLKTIYLFQYSAIVDKYIGESARLIREMFNYARDHQPCIIFMDEIDAIGGRRFSEGTSADREIQRTLMELLNQMDGFDSLGQVRGLEALFITYLKIN